MKHWTDAGKLKSFKTLGGQGKNSADCMKRTICLLLVATCLLVYPVAATAQVVESGDERIALLKPSTAKRLK